MRLRRTKRARQRSSGRRSLGERVDSWLTRTYVWGPAHPPPVRAPAPDLPTPPPTPLTVQVAAHVGAVLLPLGAAALLVPLRETVTTSTAALLLVLPVVLVAMSGRPTAGATAAISTTLAFDVLLTRPYYSLSIDAAADIESALVLAAIALVVSTLVSREVEARVRSASRHRELAAVDSVASALTRGDADRLEATLTAAVADLLDARSCHWSPGFHDRIGAELTRAGALTGPAIPPPNARGTVEIPVVFVREELGRIIARCEPDAQVSAEERRTVLTIADLFAAGWRLMGQEGRVR
jgi:hypothetical protein